MIVYERIRNQEESLRDEVLHQLQYITDGQLQRDLDTIFQVYNNEERMDLADVQAIVRRVKSAIFANPYVTDLIIPDGFYYTPIGQLLRSVECGNNVSKQLTVMDIAQDLRWSRQWVIAHLYDKENSDLEQEDRAGRMPAVRTGNGYLIDEPTYLHWKETEYSQKRRRKRHAH